VESRLTTYQPPNGTVQYTHTYDALGPRAILVEHNMIADAPVASF
jgi:hypothetical protein